MERCTRLFRAYAAGATSDLRRARIAYVEVIGVSPRLDRQRLDRRSRWIDLLSGQMTEAAARGEIPADDFRLIAAAFVGTINGLMHDWLLGWVDASLDQVLDELLETLKCRLRPFDVQR